MKSDRISVIKDTKELEFAIFCIENVAEELGVGAERIYRAFTEQSELLNQYIIPEYGILHTQSKGYIVADLLEIMEEEGINI